MIPLAYQEGMRKLKNEVSSALSKIESLRRWVEDLFDDDEKMCLMSLTKLRKKPELYAFPLKDEILKTHEEVEIIVDFHYRGFNTLISKFTLLKQQLTSSQEMVSMKLDTTRNELLKTNMILSIVALYLTIGGFVAGIFGMNLDNTIHLQFQKHVFISVTVITSGCIIIGSVITVLYFKGKHRELFSE
jgi:Mg2+ and Co2+ transporter CorA